MLVPAGSNHLKKKREGQSEEEVMYVGARKIQDGQWKSG